MKSLHKRYNRIIQKITEKKDHRVTCCGNYTRTSLDLQKVCDGCMPGHGAYTTMGINNKESVPVRFVSIHLETTAK